MMRRNLSLWCGNKGFIFTLDVVVAFILLLILIASFSIYFRESNSNELYLKRLGYDAVLMLDYNGSLKTLDENIILKDMQLFLPENYDMRILLNGMTIGSIPKGDTIAGDRFFYINSSNF